MLIGEKEYKEIIITNKQDEVLALITDADIVEEKNYRVTCVPIEE